MTILADSMAASRKAWHWSSRFMGMGWDLKTQSQLPGAHLLQQTHTSKSFWNSSTKQGPTIWGDGVILTQITTISNSMLSLSVYAGVAYSVPVGRIVSWTIPNQMFSPNLGCQHVHIKHKKQRQAVWEYCDELIWTGMSLYGVFLSNVGMAYLVRWVWQAPLREEQEANTKSPNNSSHFPFPHLFPRKTDFQSSYLESWSRFCTSMFDRQTNMVKAQADLIKLLLMWNTRWKNNVLAFVRYSPVHKTQAHSSSLNHGPV